MLACNGCTQTSVQDKIETLSAVVARGYLIDTNLKVVNKHGWYWKILSFLRTLLQPIASCLGRDLFQAYRSDAVATALFKLCEQSPENLSVALKAKIVTQILIPLDAKTKGKYHNSLEKAKADILAVGGIQKAIVQRKSLVLKALNGFAHDLHLKLAAQGQKSICFAPLSLAPVLGMILQGLPERKKTIFLKELGLKDLAEPLVHLALRELIDDVAGANGDLCSIKVANAMAAPNDTPIFPEYREAITKIYKAQHFSVPKERTAGASLINAWIAEKTGGHIRNLISANDLPDGAFFVLLNGVYFDGKWAQNFKKTKSELFTFANGGPKDVQMMSVKGNYRSYEGDTFRMLEIPYKSPKGHRLAHLVFLPNRPKDLHKLEARLTPEFIAECRQKVKLEEFQVKMPKLNVDVKTELLDILEAMDLPIKDELTELANEAHLTKILHQATIKVDEKGTVATAATAAMGACESAPMPKEPKNFHINHDYVYYITDNDHVLFQGNVKHPEVLVR